MIVFRGIDEIPANYYGPTAIAIGKFDGVHAGHRMLIDRLRSAAGDAKTVAVTFDRNPLALLAPKVCPPEVVTLERKLELLAELDLDATLVLTFDHALAEQSAEDFVANVLVDALHAQTVMLGHDFRFGRRGSGDAQLLEELGAASGFSVEILDDVYFGDESRRISSIWIRELLADGNVSGAALALGRPVTVRGEVVHGAKRGRELGFPTANLSTSMDALAPADGVYAGILIDHTTDTRYPAAISVGTNPTFDDVVRRQVEAYVIDGVGLDLYGHDVTVQFEHHLRPMVAYTGPAALVEQMQADVNQARVLLQDGVTR